MPSSSRRPHLKMVQYIAIWACVVVSKSTILRAMLHHVPQLLRLLYTYDASTSISTSHVWTGTQAQTQEKGTRSFLLVLALVVFASSRFTSDLCLCLFLFLCSCLCVRRTCKPASSVTQLSSSSWPTTATCRCSWKNPRRRRRSRTRRNRWLLDRRAAWRILRWRLALGAAGSGQKPRWSKATCPRKVRVGRLNCVPYGKGDFFFVRICVQ